MGNKYNLNYKRITLFVALFATLCAITNVKAESTRPERRLIIEGNELFVERKFQEASKKYQDALNINPSSAVGRYNLGLSQIKQVTNLQDTTPQTKSMLQQARGNLQGVASMAADKPGLASKANYNLGNLEFNSKDYKKAVEYYKQALRIDPTDEKARKNLRIAQKNLQNQDQNKDNNQNQDQQQQQQQDQDKQDNQDKQDKKDRQQNQENQEQQQNINQQTADQILQAMENKENQTRARVNRASKGEKANGGASARKKW